MSLILTRKPDKLSLLNELDFNFVTDNMYSSDGIAASVVLTFTAIATPGQIISFSDGTVLTGSADPDNSGTQFKTTATSIALFIEDVFDCFESNYPLSLYYNFSHTSSTITLTAKEVGYDYSIYLASSYSGVSDNNSAINGADKVMRSFFSLYILLFYKARNNTDYILFNDSTVFALNQKANYNPSEIINSNTDSFAYPVNSILTNRNDILIEYYLRYAESFGIPNEVQKIETTEKFYLLPGRINKKLEQYLNDLEISYWSKYKIVRGFLTNHKGIKDTSINELQKLYYLVSNEDTVSISVLVDIYFDDGSISTLNLANAAAGIYDIFEINIKASDFSINKNIDKFDIYIEEAPDNPPSIYSERFKFNIDYKNYKNKRSYIFRNSLGVYETIRVLDDSTEQVNIESEILTVDLYDNYRNRNITRSVSNIGTKINVLTGYINNKELIPFYLEFITSEDLFEIVDNRLYPITINTKKILILDDNKSRINISFSYFRESDVVFPTTLPTPAFSYAFSNAFKIN